MRIHTWHFVLRPEDCVRRLGAAGIGRVAVVVKGRPEIFPINYVVDDGCVLFMTRPGTKLDAATDWPYLSFETDGIDASTGEGWSVAVVGRAEVVEDAATVTRASARREAWWGKGAATNTWLRIVPEKVTGRRISGPSDDPRQGRFMDPLREEHEGLVPEIAELATTADAVGSASDGDLRTELDERLVFLVRHLLPHAMAEDAVLYPEVDRLIGAGGATATMRRDHVEIERLTEELGALRDRLHLGESATGELAQSLRRVLYGLSAVVRLHVSKEEEIYLPLLERGLHGDAAARLFERMDVVAHAHASETAAEELRS